MPDPAQPHPVATPRAEFLQLRIDAPERRKVALLNPGHLVFLARDVAHEQRAQIRQRIGARDKQFDHLVGRIVDVLAAPRPEHQRLGRLDTRLVEQPGKAIRAGFLVIVIDPHARRSIREGWDVPGLREILDRLVEKSAEIGHVMAPYPSLRLQRDTDRTMPTKS